ncbi:sensor domain-containing protein [Mycobacterium sp. NPDC050853]|uniref:sensor domain-containing protein n=1 Tax=Mycobacterium sp. NPDC050853 TaxID=3155160 RepID=UPI0033E4E0D5
MTRTRWAGLGLIAMAWVAGCAHPASPVAEQPPTPEIAELNVSAAAADSLFAGLDEVKFLGFPTADTTHTETAPISGPGIDPRQPCGLLRAVTSQGDLGDGWQAFRQLSIGSTTNRSQVLREAIAIFPDKPAAQTEFHRLTEAFSKCKAQSADPNAFGMHNPITLEWADNAGATDVHTTGNVVYEVTSSGATDNPEVAGQVANQMKTNIIDPA